MTYPGMIEGDIPTCPHCGDVAFWSPAIATPVEVEPGKPRVFLTTFDETSGCYFCSRCGRWITPVPVNQKAREPREDNHGH